MFKYLKRQTSRRRSSHEFEDGTSTSAFDDVDSGQKRHSLRSTSSFCDEIFFEQIGKTLELGKAETASVCDAAPADEEIFTYNSRLSMTLASIVSDTSCLSYFVQYLETKNVLPLIKFYLDIENFKCAAVSQFEKQKHCITVQLNREMSDEGTKSAASAAKATEDCFMSTNLKEEDEEEGNEGEEKSDVPELKSLCDLSMRKPLTDDEKSQIYAETNKQISKCNTNHQQQNVNRLKANSELSLCSAVSENGAACISAVSVKDAITIYQKYLILHAAEFVELPVSILAHISLLLCKDTTVSDDCCRPAEVVKPVPASCFDEARDYVFNKLEHLYLQEFLQSSYFCTYCLELVDCNSTSSSNTLPLTIYDVLFSEAALFYFMEYLEQQNERECLDFWTTAINFRKLFFANTTDTAQNSEAFESAAREDAMIIYERFFSLQSDCRLWLSDKLRCYVEQRICARGQEGFAFDVPLQIIAKYLEQKYFAGFLKSKLFDSYRKELKAKVWSPQSQTNCNNRSEVQEAQLTHKLGLRRATSIKAINPSSKAVHRKSMSDFAHISQQNTLLAAMDTTKPATNMNIDARQLTNPNLLWQRHCTSSSNGGGGLKFGRVNSLGRYERDFEAPDTATLKQNWSLSGSGAKIKNVMRKLVNMPEEKVQEEIAWQVAEMIVKDITSVTLHSKSQKP